MWLWLAGVTLAIMVIAIWQLRRHPHWLRRLAARIGRGRGFRRWLSRLIGQLLLPPLHSRLLQGLLELDNCTVNDIMIPRQAVTGIDLDDDVDSIVQTLRTTQHTRLPVYRGDLNHTVGILHVRNATRFLGREQLRKAELMQLTRAPYFLPERTPLPTQLLEFQKHRRRLGLVVNEYGDVQGVVTLESILEELVGEFTTRAADRHPDITAQPDGSYLIDGSASLRTINRSLGWSLPTDGARTLNGLLLERLETIPEAPVGIALGSYRIEVQQLRGHLIKTARVWKITS